MISNRKSAKSRWLVFSGAMLASGALLAVNIHRVPVRRLLSGKIEIVRVEDLSLKIVSPGIVEPVNLVSVKNESSGNVSYKAAKEGAQVRQGDVLMEFSMLDAQNELQRRQARLEEAQAELIKAKENLSIVKELSKARAVTQKEVAEANQGLTKAEKVVDTARKDLEAQEKKITQSKVVSPIDGVILADKVGTNVWVGQGQELFIIGQMDKFQVRAKVDELEISKIRPGQPAEVRLEAFPGTDFPAVVSRIGAQAQQGAFAEIDVFVEMTDLKGIPVKPNLSAKVNFLAGQVNGAMTVPLSCVRYEGDSNFVSVLSPGGVVLRRKVELGPSSEGKAVILDGLGAGEIILVPSDEEDPSLT